MTIDESTCKEYGNTLLAAEEVAKLLREVPQWQLKGKVIERAFQFRDFKEVMEFVNHVAALAEAEAHHPDILISYSKVVLTLSTHKVGGLSCKDFMLAAKIDRLG